MLPAPSTQGAKPMTTLVYNHEEIAPRQLKPALFELDGISRESVEAHYKLYEGYVSKRNEILGKLGEVDPAQANQVYSEIRALKVELSFAVGGVKNHEIYFEHLGGDGGNPDGAVGELIERDAARRTRRVRACVLPGLPHRPSVVHRCLLPQPGLGGGERLGDEVRHPA